MTHVNYRDILRHHANGRSQSQIAQACGCARATVQDVLKLAGGKGVTWDDVAPLTEQAAYELVRGRPRDASDGYEPIDYDHIERELSRDRTMTLTILWEEYCMRAVRDRTRPYGYSRFCELYSRWCDKHDVAITKRYIAGDLAEFDWAGQKMAVANEVSGEVTDAYLFVACLPFSQFSFVAAYPSMDVEHWCMASADAFDFFGGVPRILVIDNLRTGVTKHAPDEIVLNRTFREFSEHYNIAVIPHAPRRPRAKASVESSVGKIANRIRNMLRNQTFFSFDELNAAIRGKLADINERPFQKRAGSRKERFEEAEREALQPLPARPFEIAHWTSSVTVPKSYHVLLAQDGVYYSVPHRFVAEKVRMRFTASVVEIFCEGESIAVHRRDRTKKRGEHVTAPDHRPSAHTSYLEHDSDWFRACAKAVGPAALAVVESFLSEGIAEEQGWRYCEKLLSNRKSLGEHALEEICESAIAVTDHPSYKSINLLIRAKKARAQRAEGALPPDYAIRRFS